MSFQKEVALLSKALKDRDISFSPDELKKAVEADGGSTITTWIQEYITHDTLLTKEELSLYKALKKSGEIEALEMSTDLATARPRTDQEIQFAIEDLKRQTSTIEKQTETLKTQQDAVANLIRKTQQNTAARQRVNNEQYRNWTAEDKMLSTQLDELLKGLDHQITELADQLKISDASIQQMASRTLNEDDKLFTSLQKLAWDLDSESPEEEELAQRVRDLCARLIKHTVEGVRTRLDRVYLEAIKELKVSNENFGGNNSEVAALQDELESLYSEILPVAQMSAEQQFLGPAVQARSAKSANGKIRTDAAVKYMIECVSALSSRLHTLIDHVEEYQSHRVANTQFVNAVKMELAAARPTSPLKQPPKIGSPIRRKQSKPTSPVRLRGNRRRSSGGSFDEDMAPEHQILRNLGLAIPDTSDDSTAVASQMLEALADRKNKLRGHALNLQETEETSIFASLHDAYLTLGQLRESLLRESKFGRVSLVDEEIEEAISLLEKEVEGLDLQTGIVDVEKLKERNVLRDTLVERWGR